MKRYKFKGLFISSSLAVALLAGCGGGDNDDTNANADTGNNADNNAGAENTGNNDAGEENEAEASDSDAETTIRVAWWGGQERHDMTIEAIELFEEEHPDISVEPEYTSWDGYWERLSTQAAGSNLPDVINMDNSRLMEYNSRDLIVDLQPMIDEGLINMDDVEDVYQEINVDEDGKVMAISLGANALGIIENEDLLEEHGIELEPGYTYEEMMDAMHQIQDATDEEFFGFDFANAEFEMFFVYARQHGQSVFNEAGDGLGYEDEVLVDFFDMVQSMVNEDIAASHDIMMDYIDGGDSMLGEGSAALGMAASNQIIGAQQTTDMQLGLNVMPSVDGGQDGNWIRPSMSFSISENSEEQEAAATFIDFFTNNLEANEILQADRGVPVSSTVREHLADQVDGAIAETFEYLELVENYTSPADPLSPPGEAEVRGSFQRVVEALKYDQVTPEEAAEQFRQESESMLQ
ncbi:ABC transporter substrate-binding protein [Alkalicoccus daliensis]|uniref:Carbohydrate ABC transporter substrate-binding protein, CUT1 family n=1 Tax=Alkalicoccus daliensis TaxID=745820 RepID=A0A1H0EYY5_9BACI|nr:extracellular solute-binding protein [Alkalicoccus daliensis]SDN87614.1 carbohydrate ABC transporter substrate-binding protein, CUT1 family [Alkalicoccus daliensis]